MAEGLGNGIARVLTQYPRAMVERVKIVKIGIRKIERQWIMNTPVTHTLASCQAFCCGQSGPNALQGNSHHDKGGLVLMLVLKNINFKHK